MSSFYLHFRVALLLAAIVPTVMLRQAQAVIVSTTTENTTAPADDFGFANVGVISGATGVYLGYRWVLTATHVGANQIVLDGVTYAYETGTGVQLSNPPGEGLSTYADLTLFRITEDPWLPSLKIADEYMDAWDDVIMMGHGRNRADELIAWDISGTYPMGKDWIWTETALPGGDAQGYYMASGRILRWGTNRVEPGMYAIDVDGRDILAFSTDFDQDGGTLDEAQAASGDSGGGVFHKNGSQWELVGIMHAVSGFPNQPSQAIFGLETYCSDLSVYHDEILEIITPLGGDANLDGVVDAIDASILAAHWGLSEGAFWGHGDFNEDGIIDQQDAAILADNWGTTSTSEQSGVGVGPMIPEPSAIGLMVTGLIGLLARRARREKGVTNRFSASCEGPC